MKKGNIMKAMCEKVIPSSDCSWRFVKYEMPYRDFNWHYHPDYEICLTLNSTGLRYVGNSIEEYQHADLVIIGPDMPHTWHSTLNKDSSIQTVYVAQIPKDWINGVVEQHPELCLLKKMLQQSVQGIVYGKKVSIQAIELFEKIEIASPFTRYVLLMSLLDIMNNDADAVVLANNYYSAENKPEAETDKLDKVISHIYQHFAESLCASELAKLAHMSTSHFHRYFKKRTERTLTEFINQLRIGYACKLLINTNLPISLISGRCGFSNVSNFNRRFLLLKKLTPSQFRKQVQAPSSVA